METIIVLVIVAAAALFVMRGFYRKLKNTGNSQCGCSSCDSCRPHGNGENKNVCPESCENTK